MAIIQIDKSNIDSEHICCAIGNDKLNKIRGKAISLHSQYIGEFCTWAGAYHLRTRLIKKAKLNGDILGFLV